VDTCRRVGDDLKGGAQVSDNWNTYFTIIDNKPASFFLDMEPWKEASNDPFIHLYQLRVFLKEPTENGLTSNKEAADLFAIEDSIHDSLNGHYLFVGRVTAEGRRDFYYYLDSLDATQLESLAAKYLDHYSYSLNRIEEQSPRAFYHEFLFPDKSDMHRMTNRQLVDKLSELGDQLEISRTVYHWIYFNSADARDGFKDKVRKDGFQCDNEATQNKKYMLKISRDDSVDFHSISGVTDYLVSAALEFDGDYDGWETKVTKEQEGFLKGLKKLFKSKK